MTKIPKGKVATYVQASQATGVNSPRVVGRVLHNNPDPKRFPCHRVVFKDGSLAKNFAFGGDRGQRALLKSEGVSFAGKKVDMLKHRIII